MGHRQFIAITCDLKTNVRSGCRGIEWIRWKAKRSGDAEPAVTFESHSVISAHHLFSLCISLLFLQSKSQGSSLHVTEEKQHRDVGMGKVGSAEPCVKYKSSVKGDSEIQQVLRSPPSPCGCRRSE